MNKIEKKWFEDIKRIIGINEIGYSFTYMFNKAIENIEKSDKEKPAWLGRESPQALSLEYFLGWDLWQNGLNPRIRTKKEVKTLIRLEYNTHKKVDVDKYIKNALRKMRSEEYRKHLQM